MPVVLWASEEDNLGHLKSDPPTDDYTWCGKRITGRALGKRSLCSKCLDNVTKHDKLMGAVKDWITVLDMMHQ
jgi:hypothetical protein